MVPVKAAHIETAMSIAQTLLNSHVKNLISLHMSVMDVTHVYVANWSAISMRQKMLKKNTNQPDLKAGRE